MANYGSPIKQCHSCKQYFIDRSYREIAVQGIKRVDTLPITYSTVACLVYLAFATLGSIMAGFVVGFFLFGGLGIWVVYRDCSGREEREKILEQEKQASEERLNNPFYALTLKKLGYHVPECYLPANIIKDK